MNLLKKGIFAMLVAGFVVSCQEDDAMVAPTESETGVGLSEIIFSSFKAEAGADADGLEDGTYITVSPLTVGASSIEVDFGIGGSPLTAVQGGTISYDYPNNLRETTYTITVTAKSDEGLADVVQTTNLTVAHSVNFAGSAPASPTVNRYNAFSIFTNGLDVDGVFIGYPIGDAATGGAITTLDSGNAILGFSYLENESGVLALKDEVVIADAFMTGVSATNIHFDVQSNFTTGIDKLKITLVDGSTEYVYNQDLTDGEWMSLDLDLAADFSMPVVQFDEIKFELGTDGSASDHASLFVDNVYLSRSTGATILNGDFTAKTDFWKWGLFTEGETNPFGSSSDGSDFDIDGNDVGGKTAGAKWSGSQSGGQLISSKSRYAYQELGLTPNTDYVLEYQYAIRTGGDVIIGGNKLVGLILDGSNYVDGADAVADINKTLGFHEGNVAEGKFSETTDDRGTVVKIPFTSNDSGEVAIMFYAVTTADSYIDNVKVYLD